MTTGTSPMADVHIDRDVNASPPSVRTIPIGSPPSTSASTQPIPIQQQSRIAERAAIAQADGLMGNDRQTDGIFETDDDDFVAVDHNDVADCAWYFRHQPSAPKPSPLDELHPFVQILSVADVDDCVHVESAFPENERCSREKASRMADLYLPVYDILPMI